MFYSVLFQARLVPRWLSGWGLLAALLWLAAGVLVMFDLTEARSPTEIAMAVPLAIHEMVLAGWLITKGFDTTATDRDTVRGGSSEATLLACQRRCINLKYEPREAVERAHQVESDQDWTAPWVGVAASR